MSGLANWFRGAAAFVVGSMLTLAALELVLQALPVQRAYGGRPDAEWPVHHMVPNSQYTFSSGWTLEDVRHGHINNLGYAAPFDYQFDSTAIVVLGDSFVESLMNDYSQSLQGLLPDLLRQPVPVLNFGTSGGNLAHDLGVAGLVGARFKPTAAVILITRGSFLGGFKSSPGYFRWTTGAGAGVELVPERYRSWAELVRRLALVRYVRANLRADLHQLLGPRGRGPSTGCSPVTLSAGDEALVDFTVSQLPLRLRLPAARIILVFDAERDRIYAPERAEMCPTRDALALLLLERRATRSGFGVIDMEPIFRDAFHRTGEHFDYSPVDSHWNGTGHRLAAQAVARYLNAPDTGANAGAIREHNYARQ
jgi:hypothetical protein